MAEVIKITPSIRFSFLIFSFASHAVTARQKRRGGEPRYFMPCKIDAIGSFYGWPSMAHMVLDDTEGVSVTFLCRFAGRLSLCPSQFRTFRVNLTPYRARSRPKQPQKAQDAQNRTISMSFCAFCASLWLLNRRSFYCLFTTTLNVPTLPLLSKARSETVCSPSPVMGRSSE